MSDMQNPVHLCVSVLQCVCTHLHELLVLLWIKVSLQVGVTEGELLITGELLKLLQLLHDLSALQVLQLLQLLPLLLFLL